MSYMYTAPVLSGTIPDPVGNPLTGDLTWTVSLDGSTPATDYEVYRADIGNLANTSSLAYNDTVPTFGSYTYTVAAVGGDPTTLLLMHLDGSFNDSSSYGWPTTASGTGSFSSTIFKFNESFDVPLYNPFSTSAPAYVPFTALGPLDIFATSAWTIELFAYPIYSANPGAFLLNYNGSPNTGYNPGTSLLLIVEAESDTTVNVTVQNNGAFGGAGNLTASLPAGSANNWNHIALVNNGTTTVLYVNGTFVGPTATTTNFNAAEYVGAFVNSTVHAPAIVIGAFGGYNGNRQECLIDEIRVSAAVLYTANFTPPTAPFSVNNIQLSPLSNPVTLIYGGLSSLYGKFVGAAAYKPNLLIDAKGLKPRIWMPKENVTVKT